MTLDLFRQPIEPSAPTTEGEVQYAGRPYRWKLHVERLEPGWPHGAPVDRWEPPGFAFGVLFQDHGGVWKPVRMASTMRGVWRLVRELPEVQEVVLGRLEDAGANA